MISQKAVIKSSSEQVCHLYKKYCTQAVLLLFTRSLPLPLIAINKHDEVILLYHRSKSEKVCRDKRERTKTALHLLCVFSHKIILIKITKERVCGFNKGN